MLFACGQGGGELVPSYIYIDIVADVESEPSLVWILHHRACRFDRRNSLFFFFELRWSCHVTIQHWRFQPPGFELCCPPSLVLLWLAGYHHCRYHVCIMDAIDL